MSYSYSLAFADLVFKYNNSFEFRDKLIDFYYLVSENCDFYSLIFKCGSLSTSEPLKDILSKINLDPLLQKILFIFVEEKIVGSSTKIIYDSIIELNKLLGIRSIEIIVSEKISDNTKEKITKIISSEIRKGDSIIYSVDPSILGGMIVKIDNLIMDKSYKTKLKKLEKILHEEIGKVDFLRDINN